MDDDRNDFDPVSWAGGGGGWSGDWEPPPAVKPDAVPPTPGERRKASFGEDQRHGSVGLVCGRFLPPHRGHQYLIDFALTSVSKLVVMVFAAAGDPIAGRVRVEWLKELYPKATIFQVTAPAGEPSTWGALIQRHLPEDARTVTHFFSSEARYRPVATALAAQFVPVDPERIAVQISGTAVRENVVENFHYLAAPARSACVRRVAVVGAESTGKTTVCTRLQAEMKLGMVPEYARTFITADATAGFLGMTSDAMQLIARSQLAAEEALGHQLAEGNTGVLVCDTDLRTVRLWAQRLYDAAIPPWIDDLVPRLHYDLYLLCMPDIPFVGVKARDQPAARAKFHTELRTELALTDTPIVELSGTRDERFRAAADAIVGLYAPKDMLNRRSSHLRG